MFQLCLPSIEDRACVSVHIQQTTSTPFTTTPCHSLRYWKVKLLANAVSMLFRIWLTVTTTVSVPSSGRRPINPVPHWELVLLEKVQCTRIITGGFYTHACTQVPTFLTYAHTRTHTHAAHTNYQQNVITQLRNILYFIWFHK